MAAGGVRGQSEQAYPPGGNPAERRQQEFRDSLAEAMNAPFRRIAEMNRQREEEFAAMIRAGDERRAAAFAAVVNVGRDRSGELPSEYAGQRPFGPL